MTKHKEQLLEEFRKKFIIIVTYEDMEPMPVWNDNAKHNPKKVEQFFLKALSTTQQDTIEEVKEIIKSENVAVGAPALIKNILWKLEGKIKG